jgi:integrase/recombinase XerD
VLLDDRGYVALLKFYLARAGYTSGRLFRATINGSGGPLSYDAAHHRWEGYCADAGAGIGIHQLRHSHGHRVHRLRGLHRGRPPSARSRIDRTTQAYALLAAEVADAEIRAARRRRGRSVS